MKMKVRNTDKEMYFMLNNEFEACNLVAYCRNYERRGGRDQANRG